MNAGGGQPQHTTRSAIWAPSSRLLRGIWACVLLSAGARWLLHGLFRFASADWSQSWHYDAAVDWAAAQLFWQGGSPYTPEGLDFVGVANTGFGHPPTTPFWFLPLARFDEPTMAHVLGLLNLGMLLGLVALAVFALRFPFPALSTLVVFAYLQDSKITFDHNQIVQLSVAIAFGTVVAWKCLRDGADWRGGAVLGLTCTLKPFACLLVFFLLLQRRSSAVVAAGAAFLAVAAVMTWRFGIESWQLFVEQQKGLATYWADSVRNATLHGVLRRAFKDRCAPRPEVSDASLANAIAVGASLLLLVVFSWLVWRAWRRRPELGTFDLSYGLFCALSVFLNPRAWEHYLFVLVLPLLIAARRIGGLLAASSARWMSGGLSHRRMLGATALAGIGVVPLIALAPWTLVSVHTNRLATRAYCGIPLAPAVHDWALRRAQLLELASWLPWVLTVLLLSALLLLEPAQGEPAAAPSGVP